LPGRNLSGGWFHARYSQKFTGPFIKIAGQTNQGVRRAKSGLLAAGGYRHPLLRSASLSQPGQKKAGRWIDQPLSSKLI